MLATRQQERCSRFMDETNQMGGAVTAMVGMFPVGAGGITVPVRVDSCWPIENHQFMPCHRFRMTVPRKRQTRKEIGKQQNVEHGSFHGLLM